MRKTKFIVLILLILVLTSCSADFLSITYRRTICSDNKICEYKTSESKVLYESRFDNDYVKTMRVHLLQATKSCLVGYAVIYDYFPFKTAVLKFHEKNKINANRIIYTLLQSKLSLTFHPPFEMKVGGNLRDVALVYFYVNKERAIGECYDPLASYDAKFFELPMPIFLNNNMGLGE